MNGICSDKENKKKSENTIFWKIVLLTILTSSLLVHTNTPVSANNDRPKIGLVLSGGGAKGIAHIGILKTLEEVGLTPDYIRKWPSCVGTEYAVFNISADPTCPKTITGHAL